MTVRINKQKINLREKLAEFEDKVNFDEVVRGLGEYTGNVGIGTTGTDFKLDVLSDGYKTVKFARSGGTPHLFFANTDDVAADGVQTDCAIFLASNSEFRLSRRAGDNITQDQNVWLAGTSDGNVGIGTTNPGTYRLKIEGGNLAAETVVSVVSSGGNMVLANTATEEPYLKFDGKNSTTGLNWTIGLDDDDLTDQKNLLAFKRWDDANALKDTPLVIGSTGNVGIGTTTPGTYKLNVKSTSTNQTCRVYRPLSTGGSRVFDIVSDYTGVVETVQFLVNTDGVTQNTSGTISQISSDERLKENISDATPKLQDLLKLKVKNFNFSDDENKTKYIGFIAQEMEEVFPSLVMTKDTREYDEDGNLLSGLEDSKSTKVSMDFAILTKAIQEQQSIIEDLKSRIETLESK